MHVSLSPPALLLAWLLLHSAQLSAAGGSFGALLRIYPTAAPGDSPWLPFLWAVHTPLHALGAKLWWDRRGLGLVGGVQEKQKPE